MDFFKLLWSFLRHPSDWLDLFDHRDEWIHQQDEVDPITLPTKPTTRTMWGD